MAYKHQKSAKFIAKYIDATGCTHRELMAPLELTDSQFSDRYTGRARWKPEELKILAPMVGTTFEHLVTTIALMYV